MSKRSKKLRELRRRRERLWKALTAEPGKDAGYVYVPWIPFFGTPTAVLDDMMLRKSKTYLLPIKGNLI